MLRMSTHISINSIGILVEAIMTQGMSISAWGGSTATPIP
ncbi:hypothetical protein ADIMK_3485 [Marinobacterium lacunae]|uniref:Uncharacterized protein n=1 Tax=Marinobacterium lacunae TaxID=1232683 RepID=A0A081FUZ0_9GAMM|nr:hypothetical protein ADIMK_3485 [Marinobacterium lacunae]